jgi:hypothetical protein
MFEQTFSHAAPRRFTPQTLTTHEGTECLALTRASLWFAVPGRLLLESCTQWHVAVRRRIWRRRAVPRNDPFPHTLDPTPRIAKGGLMGRHNRPTEPPRQVALLACADPLVQTADGAGSRDHGYNGTPVAYTDGVGSATVDAAS